MKMKLSVALLFVLLLSGCHHPPEAGAIGRALDAKLAEIYLHKDWIALAAIVAPDYYASGEGFEWNRADLEQEFPKINLQDFYLERQRANNWHPVCCWSRTLLRFARPTPVGTSPAGT